MSRVQIQEGSGSMWASAPAGCSPLKVGTVSVAGHLADGLGALPQRLVKHWQALGQMAVLGQTFFT